MYYLANFLPHCPNNFAGDWRDEDRYRTPHMNDVSEWDQEPRSPRRSVTDEAVDKVVDYVNSIQLSATTARKYSYR